MTNAPVRFARKESKMTKSTKTPEQPATAKTEPVVQERLLQNEIFHADFPTTLDKYDLRSWLIGRSHMRGWRWHFVSGDHLFGMLVKEDVAVGVRIVSEGLRIGVGERLKVIETRL
jgi:hypothetical protein